MSKAVVCIMYGLGGSMFDPANGEIALVARLKALDIDTAQSPYAWNDTQAIYNVLSKVESEPIGIVGDSLGACTAPYIANFLKRSVNYLCGFQPSDYGMHVPVPANVQFARCFYNPDWIETLGLGNFCWAMASGANPKVLHVVEQYVVHPGDWGPAQDMAVVDIQHVLTQPVKANGATPVVKPPLYTPAEASAGFTYARGQINALAGWYSSMIPDSDVVQLVDGTLAVAAQVRAKT